MLLPTNNTFQQRQNSVFSWLKAEQIDAAVIEDREDHRDSNLRYLTGFPSDALLFLFREGYSVLLPWDVQLADDLAFADRIVPYNDYKRSLVEAVPSLLKQEKCAAGRIELTEFIPFPLHQAIDIQLSGEAVCRSGGISSFIRGLRAIKDQKEQRIIRRAAEATNTLLSAVESTFTARQFYTEIDVACFIIKEARKQNSEGLGFETLVANPRRSFAIHPFPSYTADPITAEGLSLLDFGIVFEGYTTDVTVPILQGAPTESQHEMVELILEAWKLLTTLIEPGASTLAICREVDALFGKRGRSMPHALGHGIGLDAHEYPILRNREDSDTILKPGMVLAVEPGLYEKESGGCRLENDILITEFGAEVLTRSRMLFVPEIR